jgi:hypothetical protein
MVENSIMHIPSNNKISLINIKQMKNEAQNLGDIITNTSIWLQIANGYSDGKILYEHFMFLLSDERLTWHDSQSKHHLCSHLKFHTVSKAWLCHPPV